MLHHTVVNRNVLEETDTRRILQHLADLWGYDVPHDWPSWQAQLAHHLPRFC